MREIIWKDDLRDGLYSGERIAEVIGERCLDIVRTAKNFIEVEGEPWILKYIKNNVTDERVLLR